MKPEFWTSAQVLECSRDARLLFIGLWNFCDDAGRHTHSPKTIKAQILPGDDISLEQVAAWLGELENQKLIRKYAIEGVEYIEITGWHHQRIDRPRKAVYPGPFDEDSTNIRGTLDDHSTLDRILKDRILKDRIVKETLRDASRSGDALNPPKIFDPAKQVFDSGVRLLAGYGIGDRKARALVGKWRKRCRDPALLAALARAGAAERADIVAFMEGCLKDGAITDEDVTKRRRDILEGVGLVESADVQPKGDGGDP